MTGIRSLLILGSMVAATGADAQTRTLAGGTAKTAVRLAAERQSTAAQTDDDRWTAVTRLEVGTIVEVVAEDVSHR